WNLQRDLARAARPASHRPATTLWNAAGLSFRVVGMFALVIVFWSCWNTPGLLRYVPVQAFSGRAALIGGAAVLGFVLLAVGVGVAVQLARDQLRRLGLLPLPLSPTASALGLTATLAVVALLGDPRVAEVFGPRTAGAIAELRQESATPAEAALV